MYVSTGIHVLCNISYQNKSAKYETINCDALDFTDATVWCSEIIITIVHLSDLNNLCYVTIMYQIFDSTSILS